MKGVVCHHYHQKSYSGIARKVLEAIGQTGREFIAAVQYETIHQIQSDWLLWLSRSFPYGFGQYSPQQWRTAVQWGVKARSEQSGWVGGWWWGQFAVLFSVLILFAPSLLLPLTPVIYDVHPSSGRVHQLLVARRSWQQLCVARGVGLAIPLLSLGAFTRTYTPPPKKQTKKNPLV